MKRPEVTRNRTQDTWLVQTMLSHLATTTGQPPLHIEDCKIVRADVGIGLCNFNFNCVLVSLPD